MIHRHVEWVWWFIHWRWTFASHLFTNIHTFICHFIRIRRCRRSIFCMYDTTQWLIATLFCYRNSVNLDRVDASFGRPTITQPTLLTVRRGYLTSLSRLSRRNSSSLSNFDFCSGTTRGILKKNRGFGCSYNPIESYGIIPAKASFIILVYWFFISSCVIFLYFNWYQKYSFFSWESSSDIHLYTEHCQTIDRSI